jgi:ferredoxin
MVDRSQCQSHGQCVRIAPDLFELDDDGYSRVRVADVPPERRADVVDAVHCCPEEAIRITDSEQ